MGLLLYAPPRGRGTEQPPLGDRPDADRTGSDGVDRQLRILREWDEERGAVGVDRSEEAVPL